MVMIDFVVQQQFHCLHQWLRSDDGSVDTVLGQFVSHDKVDGSSFAVRSRHAIRLEFAVHTGHLLQQFRFRFGQQLRDDDVAVLQEPLFVFT